MVNFTIGSEDLPLFKGQGICLGDDRKAQRGGDDKGSHKVSLFGWH